MEVVEGRLAVLETRASRVERELNALWHSIDARVADCQNQLDGRVADLELKVESYERIIETYERTQGMLLARLDDLESQMRRMNDSEYESASGVSDADSEDPHGRHFLADLHRDRPELYPGGPEPGGPEPGGPASSSTQAPGISAPRGTACRHGRSMKKTKHGK